MSGQGSPGAAPAGRGQAPSGAPPAQAKMLGRRAPSPPGCCPTTMTGWMEESREPAWSPPTVVQHPATPGCCATAGRAGEGGWVGGWVAGGWQVGGRWVTVRRGVRQLVLGWLHADDGHKQGTAGRAGSDSQGGCTPQCTQRPACCPQPTGGRCRAHWCRQRSAGGRGWRVRRRSAGGGASQGAWRSRWASSTWLVTAQAAEPRAAATRTTRPPSPPTHLAAARKGGVLAGHQLGGAAQGVCGGG